MRFRTLKSLSLSVRRGCVALVATVGLGRPLSENAWRHGAGFWATVREVGVDAVQSPIGGASRQAIEHHYDIGREFYRLWLDTRLVYSCALWTGSLGGDPEVGSVGEARLARDRGPVDGASHVLDVGCGWGAMVRYLAEERHVGHVTGLTLSSDQARAGPSSDHAEVRLEDWRDHRPARPYDAIISIGAFEHFARDDLPRPERRGVYRGSSRAAHGGSGGRVLVAPDHCV